jgi:hypothetical protein
VVAEVDAATRIMATNQILKLHAPLEQSLGT